jgi:predicted phosphodiesterase
MSKVVITADIHFGVPGRLEDIVFACEVIDQYCRKTGIDTVIVLGDMFHDRHSMGIDTMAAAASFLEKAQQKWITFPGNHDMFLRHSWGITSLIPLKRHLEVIDDIKILKLDDKRFWILPFIQLENAYMRVVNKIEEQAEEGDSLMTHIGINSAVLNTCFLLKDWSIVSFEHTKFNRIYTGHFHSKQQIGENVWYPGSLIPFKFDEGDVPHGFYVYDTTEDSHQFVNIWKAAERLFPDTIPPPQFTTILESEVETKTIADIKHNMVRVALERDYTTDEKHQIRDKLIEMGAVGVRWLNLQQKPKDSKERKIIDVTNKDLFQTWIENDKKGTKDLDISVLKDLHNEIVIEGDELYAIEEEE